MYTVVRDIHATLTPSTSCILHTGTAPAEAAEAAISFPAPAPSTAIFCDAVSPTPEPYHQKLGAHANQAIEAHSRDAFSRSGVSVLCSLSLGISLPPARLPKSPGRQ